MKGCENMNDQEQPQIQQSNDTDQFVLAKLRQELDIELEKPDSELNVNKINQLTKAIEQVTGTEKITAEKTQQGLQKLKQEIRHQKQRRVFRRTGLVAACACALIIISNIWSNYDYVFTKRSNCIICKSVNVFR